MNEPICCDTPMVHNSFTEQWECADAYFALHDDDIDPYFADPTDLDVAQQAYLEHWRASRIDDAAVTP
ncbi:hypothetical protein ABZ949_02645 [Micromonospora tulbaghiae]|uniref:hypothetical protein n=1 Tax=Micromonospora tulbaghiae TaxID=479978 RepID=UPI0033DC19F6